MLIVPTIEITQDMLTLIGQIDEFKGAWKFWQTIAPDRLNQLKHIATIESIGSSTRIEGAKLSDQEVEALLANLNHQSFRTRDEQEVAGYGLVFEEIFQSSTAMSLTENVIKHLHGWLLKYSEKDRRHCGEYKKLPNSVDMFGPDGKSLGVIFETATPFETPALMQDLVSWTNEKLEEKKMHPLLIIANFVVLFLAIHPFQDGNGRLSRLLTILLLLKTGYIYTPYSSLEHVIEENKDRYYAALRKTQQTLKNPKPLMEPWTLFFLQTLYKQKENLERKIAREKIIQSRLLHLPEVSAQILVVVKEQGRVAINDLYSLIKANPNTIKAHVQRMVKENLLMQHGKGKATWYTLGSTHLFAEASDEK